MNELVDKYSYYMMHRSFGAGRCTPTDVKQATVADGKVCKTIMSLVTVCEGMFTK